MTRLSRRTRSPSSNGGAGPRYRENTQVRLASDYRRRQFVRPCRHVHPEAGQQIVCERMMDDFELSDADRAQIVLNASRLVGALDAAPKSLAWRLRARVGTRIPWHQLVEEQD